MRLTSSYLGLVLSVLWGFQLDMNHHGTCNDCNNNVTKSQASQHQEANVLRDLFRTSSDSESSVDDDHHLAVGHDDGISQQLDVEGPQEALSQKSNASSEEVGRIRQESSVTVVRTIQHVQLEVCTVGGSIEHRLWPAAEYLVSFILQQNNGESSHESIRNQKQLNGKNAAIYAGIRRDVHVLLERFSSRQSTERLKVIELGAGVGYTSLELAHHVQVDTTDYKNNVQFLLTDLSSAIPLLQRNVHRNFGEHVAKRNLSTTNCPILIQKLEWGNMDDINNALFWYQNASVDGTPSRNVPSNDPLLILGSDCVYWESLYGILETTIAALLQNAAPHSVCLLANVRRWKRDTHFFQNVLGQSTATSKGQLHCICLHELVSRSTVSNNGDDIDDTDTLNEAEQRQVLRIYAVQWLPR